MKILWCNDVHAIYGNDGLLHSKRIPLLMKQGDSFTINYYLLFYKP